MNLVQMREKDLPDAVQLALAQRLREITSGKALLFINDSVSIAEACGADRRPAHGEFPQHRLRPRPRGPPAPRRTLPARR